jgi:hypothetical protein
MEKCCRSRESGWKETIPVCSNPIAGDVPERHREARQPVPYSSRAWLPPPGLQFAVIVAGAGPAAHAGLRRGPRGPPSWSPSTPHCIRFGGLPSASCGGSGVSGDSGGGRRGDRGRWRQLKSGKRAPGMENRRSQAGYGLKACLGIRKAEASLGRWSGSLRRLTVSGA